MQELWLKYRDSNGIDQRVEVAGDIFTIGRDAENSLPVSENKLSRRHLQIERFSDVFMVSDLGSSNGTFLNGAELKGPVRLNDGDRLDLGGGLEIVAELPGRAVQDDYRLESLPQNVEEAPEPDAQARSVTAASQTLKPVADTSGIPKTLFIVAPLLGLLILVSIGVLVVVFGGAKGQEVTRNTSDVEIPSKLDDEDTDVDIPATTPTAKDPDAIETPTPASNQAGPNNTATPVPTTDVVIENTGQTSQTPRPSSDAEKIERNSALFMRRVAMNDPKAFLTTQQIGILSPKLSQFKGSAALADNLKAAKKAQSQLATMAASKNLKPEFLAVAALARLGNSRGDVVSTAQGMLEVLDGLAISIGNESADDSMIMIAAFDQGVAGQKLAMRDTIANLAKQSPNVTSRTIRTIWFLRENGKLTDPQFDFALRFLAIGTIAQNPKEFGVNSEAVVFN